MEHDLSGVLNSKIQFSESQVKCTI